MQHDLQPWAVIEVAADADEEVRERLILAAYLWSRRGLVGLALRGIPWTTVDRALDDLVLHTTTASHGVVYLDAEARELVLRTADSASVVVASTAAFRRELTDRGIAFVEPPEAARLAGVPAASGAVPPGRSSHSWRAS